MKTTIKMRMLSMLALLIPACVTINIYFPAAAAEQAADKIIDEVWQLKPGEKPAPQSTELPAENSSANTPEVTPVK